MSRLFSKKKITFFVRFFFRLEGILTFIFLMENECLKNDSKVRIPNCPQISRFAEKTLRLYERFFLQVTILNIFLCVRTWLVVVPGLAGGGSWKVVAPGVTADAWVGATCSGCARKVTGTGSCLGGASGCGWAGVAAVAAVAVYDGENGFVERVGEGGSLSKSSAAPLRLPHSGFSVSLYLVMVFLSAIYFISEWPYP